MRKNDFNNAGLVSPKIMESIMEKNGDNVFYWIKENNI